MKRLLIYGGANQKIVHTFELLDSDLSDKSLLEFLRDHQVPVASSCLGDGVCKKCVTKNSTKTFLTCEVTLLELFQNTNEETLCFPYL
ncbi:MAG: hypothetical protein K2Q18_15155 [Bdellovibrionales bacterium]|nr:hypothetical protein [Bdellovibrionales bacterium]